MNSESTSELEAEQSVNPRGQNGQSEQRQPRKGQIMPMFRGRKPTLVRILEDQRDIYEQMLVYIRAGAWDYQVAAGMGISPETFIRWMNRGRLAKRGPFRQFYLDVTNARSQCRILAEISVRQDDPKFWLTHGPGKTRPDQPGWTDQVIVSGDSDMPLSVEHNHKGGIEVTQAATPPQELAASLAILQQLGIFGVDPATNQPVIRGIAGTPAIVNGTATMVVDDEDESGDDDDDGVSDKGYVPDADVPLDIIQPKPPRR